MSRRARSRSPHMSISDPTAMRNHGHESSPRDAASTVCPPHRRHVSSLRHHTSPPRPTTLTTRSHGIETLPLSTAALALLSHDLQWTREREGEEQAPGGARGRSRKKGRVTMKTNECLGGTWNVSDVLTLRCIWSLYFEMYLWQFEINKKDKKFIWTCCMRTKSVHEKRHVIWNLGLKISLFMSTTKNIGFSLMSFGWKEHICT
jgi:hypothetical protein